MEVISAIGLIALLVVIFWDPAAIPGGLPAAPAGPQPSEAPVALEGAGRGRTTATVPPVVTVRPTAAPTRSTAAPATARPTSGTGSGTGTGTGTMPPKASTDERFIFVVVDAVTDKPIKGVCVTWGQECVANERRTDAKGVFWVDFPKGVAQNWDFEFWMEGYEPERRPSEYVPREEPVKIRLTRAA